MRMAALGCVLAGVLLGAAPLSAQEIVADSITQYTHPADSRAMGWELDDGSAVVLHAEKNPDGSIVALTSVVIATPTGEIYEVVLDGTTGDYMGSPADAVMALYDIDASHARCRTPGERRRRGWCCRRRPHHGRSRQRLHVCPWSRGDGHEAPNKPSRIPLRPGELFNRSRQHLACLHSGQSLRGKG